jgi:acyl carrier protein
MEPDGKIRQILGDLLSVDEEDLSDDAFLSDDLGMLPDDLEELINTLNEEFELDIPDVDAEDWETVRDVVNYVLEKIDHE